MYKFILLYWKNYILSIDFSRNNIFQIICSFIIENIFCALIFKLADFELNRVIILKKEHVVKIFIRLIGKELTTIIYCQPRT